MQKAANESFRGKHTFHDCLALRHEKPFFAVALQIFLKPRRLILDRFAQFGKFVLSVFSNDKTM